ncbi:MAG: hypothetical protein HKP06_12880 [Flavobacteriaceae bacterium]|nr:hypothetical protein [Flavobacteriaceae bacterium]
MRYFLVCLTILLISCQKEQAIVDPLEHVLKSDSPLIKIVMDSIHNHEVQIRYTEISRENGSVSFKDHDFNIDDSTYFYPASSVKFPVAILALEKMQQDGSYTLNTPFFVEGDTAITTLGAEIKKIFAISDNDAYNRLFEYLGKDYINNSLNDKGIAPSRISHRLSTNNAYELRTKSLVFYENDSTLNHTEGIDNNAIEELQLNNIVKGIGYYANDELIGEPFDFSLKNYLPISTLHDLMKRMVFPEVFPKDQQFNLSSEDRDFLLTSMSSLPKDNGYVSDEYYDSYVKFFMYGDSKEPMPEHIKIYNKVGYAYGYLTDCAYIKDVKNNIDFMVTATIHVNADGIFNDDAYEYEEIGIPFLAEIGRQIYNYELTKK